MLYLPAVRPCVCCAVDLAQEGNYITLRNAKIDMYRGSMRLAVDQWGKVEALEGSSFKPKVCSEGVEGLGGGWGGSRSAVHMQPTSQLLRATALAGYLSYWRLACYLHCMWAVVRQAKPPLTHKQCTQLGIALDSPHFQTGPAELSVTLLDCCVCAD